MTNSMRWGLTSVTALGLIVAGSAFVGCSSSSSGGTTTPDDTGSDDSATDSVVQPDTSGDTVTPDMGADVPDTNPGPAVPDRKVTIVHVSPDAGAQLFCFGAGAANTLGKALIIGKPDATAPTDASKYTGFAYGSVAPISIPMDGLISKAEVDALSSLTVYAFPIGATNPLTATAHDAAAMLTACTAKFNAFKSDAGIDTSKFISFSGAKLAAGTSTVLYAEGCTSPGATLAGCAGKPFSLGYKQFDLSTPTFAGDSGTSPKVSFHFMHASPFPGATGVAPSWQNVDVYLLPMSKPVAGTDAGPDGDTGAVASTATGAPQLIATNVQYGDFVGVQVPVAAGDAGTDASDSGTVSNPPQPFISPANTSDVSSYLVLMPHGVTFCAPGTSGCVATPLPLDPWLSGYKAAFAAGGYPPVGFVDATHQMIVLSGSPSDDATNPVKYGLNLAWANVSKP